MSNIDNYNTLEEIEGRVKYLKSLSDTPVYSEYLKNLQTSVNVDVKQEIEALEKKLNEMQSTLEKTPQEIITEPKKADKTLKNQSVDYTNIETKVTENE